MKHTFANKLTFAMLIMALAIISGAGAFAASEDEGLYDPVPTENSAYVRFIHAQPEESELPPKVNGKERDGVKFGGVKPYSVIAPGKIAVEMGSFKTEFDAEAKGRYTVILQNKALRVEKDPMATNDLKAHIVVYNLTDLDDIAIKTADGKINVVGPIKAGQMMNIEVNPIKVSLKVFSGDKEFATLNEWPLERKENYIIAIVKGDVGGIGTYDRARISEE